MTELEIATAIIKNSRKPFKAEAKAEFSESEVKAMGRIRTMLFERMASMSTTKAKNNANEAITVIEKMAKELGHPFY